MNNKKAIYGILISRFFLTLNFIALIKEVFLQDSGIDISVIVLTGFFYQVSKALFELPTGYFADRYGYKSSVIIGIVIQIMSILTLTMITNFTTILSFILVGFGNTFISGAFDALLYEKIADINQTIKYKIINYKQYIDMGSRALALILVPCLLNIGGYNFIILLSITSLIFSILCLLLVKTEVDNNLSSQDTHHRLRFDLLKSRYLENKEVFGYFIVRKSFTIFDIPLEKFTILLLLNKGLSFEMASIIFAISFFTYPLFSSISRISKVARGDKWLLWSPLFSDICILIFILTPNSLIAILMYFLSSFIIASSSIHHYVKVNSLISNKNRATLLSIDSLIMTFTAAAMYLLLSCIVANLTLLITISVIFALILNIIGRTLISKSKQTTSHN